MRPTRLGSARRGQVRLGLGFDPDEPIGEPEEPTDYLQDESAMAWYPVSGGGTTALIQSATATVSGSDPNLNQNISLGSPVTGGSLLVALLATRSFSGTFSTPTGWTDGGQINTNGFNSGDGAVFYKVADGTEGTGPFTFDTEAVAERRLVLAEFSGPNNLVDSASTTGGATASYNIGDVTPSGGEAATLIAAALNSDAISGVTGYTNISTGPVGVGSNGPISILAYKAVDPASGDYGATVTQTSQDIRGGVHLAFSSIADPAWIPAPLTIDDDDATYHEVIGHTECWRGQLFDNYQIGRARLVIGTETSGSRSYDLEGQTLADIGAETGTPLGTFEFTASGSYIADTIDITITGADGYQFYRLIGPDENRYIYTVNLFSPPAGGGVSDHPSLTGRSTTNQHPASAVSVADAAGWFEGDDVEADLAELAAKAIGYEGHGSMGSTETFDAAIGSHSGTLTANCTFTLTAAASGTASTLFLELIQDGTGGWTITLPGSVVNAADIEAEQDTTASETTFLALYSRDGGTTWYGGWWGGAAPSGGGVTVEDEGTPLTTTATTLDFVGAGVTASGTGATKTITISGGAGGSSVLGVTQYVRGSDGGILSSSSSSAVDVDAANAAVTFTAPASGNVLVLAECFAASDGTNYIKLGLRESTTNIYAPHLVWNVTTSGGRVSTTFYLTGVTAGSHTYKLSFAISGGGPGQVLGGPNFGSVLMVVTEA